MDRAWLTERASGAEERDRPVCPKLVKGRTQVSGVGRRTLHVLKNEDATDDGVV